MNPAEVLRRIYNEQRDWQRMNDRTPEVEWTLRGIKLCLRHVRDIMKEQRTNDRLKHPKIDHQHATRLYQACAGAARALRHSQREAAMRILRRAIEKIPQGLHGRTA